MSPLTTGLDLGDRYRLVDRLATGGMGEVWRADDRLLGRPVAVKILKREYAESPDFLDRFRAEARHAAGVAHPGVAQVFDYGEADGTPYLVLELVPGEPLSTLLHREGRLSAARTMELVAEVARALDAAHAAGVVHRDVKPGNVLVPALGTVKVTDFGIARAMAAAPVTQTGVVLGTAHYIAPEQASGQEATPASDVYSLGVVAYECLAGRRPFDADTPVALAAAHVYDEPPPLPPDVPEPVAAVVRRALAKDPARRFPTAAALAEAADAARAALDRDPAATAVLPVADADASPAAQATTTAVLPVVDADRRPAVVSAVRSAVRSRPPWAVPVAAVVAVALLGLVVAWATTSSPARRTVPRVTGQSVATAVRELRAQGLDPVVRRIFHASAPAGRVLRQDPPAGAAGHAGDDVVLTVSKGPQPVTLPVGLLGRTYEEVAVLLRARGLVPRPAYAVSGAQPGTVVAVAPTTGLHAGDPVTVTVATAPARERERGKHKGKDGDD